MLKSYFRIAWRHLLKNKGYTAINIAGLATGMAIAIVIGLWITDELTFDHYHKNHDRIAQGMITQYTPDGNYSETTVSIPMGKVFRAQYKDLFSSVAQAHDGGDHLFAVGDKKLAAPALWADRQLPEMFTFKMLSGSTSSADDPSTVLISQSLATALFGKTDPLGKAIKYDNRLDFVIGGVYEDMPDNTSFAGVKAIMPWKNKDNSYRINDMDWNDHNGQLYVLLAPGITAEQASARIQKLPSPFIKGWREEALVHALDKAHLYNEFRNGKATGGRIQFVWLFGIIGIFVLLLACINFMNLSTARSERRAKEVGIRKTIGSLKRQLVVQFLSESILVASLAFIFSVMLVEVSLPFFNVVSAKKMALPWGNGLFWILSLGFVVFTGVLAGSYPAFYLSGFDPVRVLKGTARFRTSPGQGTTPWTKFFRAGRFASLPRKVLVVLQFSVSLTLIIGTVIVFRQIEFAKDRPVGYNREGLVTVNINTPELSKHYEALRLELIQNGLVENVAASSMRVTGFFNGNEVYWRGKRPDQEAVFFRNVNVSTDFGPTVGWKVLQGRDFDRAHSMDTSSMILNASAAKVIGIKQPVGESMKLFGKAYTVIGVVNDMITNSPYDEIQPAVFVGDGYRSAMTMRLKAGQPVHTLLENMAPIFKKYNPGSPFIYQFMDDDYARKFEAEQRIGNLASVFTSLAIFISCLGLFGLASFLAEQRTREIGVRKVLGAGVFGLWGLLSRDFVKLVVISFFISMPLGYLLMNKWLQNYTYRTGIPWWIFAASAGGILLITLLTVSYQSLKAATMNPVKSLRSE